MRRILIGLGLIALITLITVAVRYPPPTTEPPNSDTPPSRPPVTFEQSKRLKEALRNARAQGHLIGIIANGDHRAIEIIDLTDRVQLGNLTATSYPYSISWGIDFMPDGSTLILSTAKEVVFVDWETLNITRRISIGDYVDDLAVNPLRNEAYLFGNGDVDKNIYVLDLKSFHVTTIPLPYGYPWHALSPDFETLYVASEGQIQYFDTKNHTVTRRIVDDTVSFGRIIPSGDGSILYAQYVAKSDEMGFGAIGEYNVSSGRLIKSFANITAHDANVGVLRAMSMYPSGDKLLLQEQSEKLMVLDLGSGKVDFYPVEDNELYWGGAIDVVFSPDGSEIYLLYNGAVAIDTPMPPIPSLIDFRDAASLISIGNFTLPEGCYRLLIAPH
jgi:DNA-binding beta-propeller fold protein YncE